MQTFYTDTVAEERDSKQHVSAHSPHRINLMHTFIKTLYKYIERSFETPLSGAKMAYPDHHFENESLCTR